jgi:DEAD/DEAH box helicase domain-containing protein
MITTEVFFDLETKKMFQDINTFNPADLGVSIVSLYSREVDDSNHEINGEMMSFWESDFEQMWNIFKKADRIIGFNSLDFDVPALIQYCPYNFKKLPHFDILQKIKNSLGFRLSLDTVAKETLGHSKIDVGSNAVLYWNQQTEESLKKLKTYCEMDVLITKEIYDFGLKVGHLKYKDKWNTPRLVEIDFAYPKKEKSNADQMGLF